VKADHLEQAIETVRGKHVIVSFSGGKDSLVVMDLAVRHAASVHAFFLELLPLTVMDAQLAIAEQRWGIPIRRLPHWLRYEYWKFGAYCFHHSEMAELRLNDLYGVIRKESGAKLIVTGAKASDSLWRRRTGVAKFAGDDLKAPLWHWSKKDVLQYLRAKKIPQPDNDGRNATGIDLSYPSVLWLYDNYPDDFRRLEQLYPFVGAIIKRREWYGYSGGAKEKA